MLTLFSTTKGIVLVPDTTKLLPLVLITVGSPIATHELLIPGGIAVDTLGGADHRWGYN